MYLGTGELIAIIIALSGALIVMGLSIKENIRLNSENAWLRQRNQQLKKQLENSTELPWKAAR